jgi:signal transduction histidine kinase
VVYVYAGLLFFRYGWNHDRISKTQLGAQFGAISAPYVVGSWIDGNQIVDGVTGGLLLSGLLLAVSLRRYPVLIGFPKADYVARSRVFEELQEAVFVVDWDSNILDANSTAENLFDRTTQSMIGTPMLSVVEGMSGADLSTGTTETVTLQTAKGRRRFQYTVSPVEAEGADSDSAPVARTILLRDITDERTREQRLSVLNRVLRHNVQNKLDVTLAHADRIEDDVHRTAIQKSADDLLSISQKARDAEAVMTDTVGSPSPMDLVAVVRTVATNAREEHPETEIEVSAPERLQVVSHRTVVQRLAAELVENAIVHSGTPVRVEIEVTTTTDGTPQLRVVDNGPGIPDRERDLLTGTGETQLEHGLGVGLWFVNWAVSQLGAELAFERANSAGTVVVVEFHGFERRGETDRSMESRNPGGE